MASTILVVDPSKDFCQAIELYFKRRGLHVVTVPGAEQALTILNEKEITLIVLEMRLPKMSGTDFIRLLRRQARFTHTPVLVISSQRKPAQVADAYKAGADDYLIKPIEFSIVQTKVDLLIHRIQFARERSAQSLGKVIPFFSAKGGSGRSTAIAYLGSLLSTRLTKQTVILDLNLDFPGMAPLLNLQPRSGLKDISEDKLYMMSNDDLQQFMTTHESGLQLLPGTLDAFEAELVSNHVVEAIVRRLRETHDFIFIDMAPRYSPLSMAIFDLADYICLTFAARMLAVVITSHARDVLIKSRIPMQKILLLGNRTQPGQGITDGQLQKVFGDALIGTIPYTSTLEDAENRGKLLNELYPRAPISKVIETLAMRLIDLPAPQRSLPDSGGNGALSIPGPIPLRMISGPMSPDHPVAQRGSIRKLSEEFEEKTSGRIIPPQPQPVPSFTPLEDTTPPPWEPIVDISEATREQEPLPAFSPSASWEPKFVDIAPPSEEEVFSPIPTETGEAEIPALSLAQEEMASSASWEPKFVDIAPPSEEEVFSPIPTETGEAEIPAPSLAQEEVASSPIPTETGEAEIPAPSLAEKEESFSTIADASPPLSTPNATADKKTREVFILSFDGVTILRLEHLFAANNYITRSLAGPRKALQVFQERQGVASIIDLRQLTQPSGRELFELFKRGDADGNDYHLVLVGVLEEIEQARSAKLGASYLSKPIDPQSVADLIKSWEST